MPRQLLVATVLLSATVLAACQKPADTPAPAKPATAASVPAVAATRSASPQAPPGTDVPALSVATVDGKTFELAAHRGHWVVVNFWATWCAPCLKEMPELSALDAMREHIDVVGLAYEEIEPAAMRDFLKDHPVVYPIAIVDTYKPPQDFDTPRGLPMTYLISPEGKVAKKILGPVTAHSIEAAIADAAGIRKAAPAAGKPNLGQAPGPGAESGHPGAAPALRPGAAPA